MTIRFLWLIYAAYILTIFVGNPWISLIAALVFSFTLWHLYPRKKDYLKPRPYSIPNGFVDAMGLDADQINSCNPTTITVTNNMLLAPALLSHKIAASLRTEQPSSGGDVLVDLGNNCYSALFISRAFGSLVTDYYFSVEELHKRLRIVCSRDQSLVAQAWLEIEEAGKTV